MRSRRTSAEHQEAVNRRLALLSAELSAVRPREPDEAWADPTADGTPWVPGHPRTTRGRAGSRETELQPVEDTPPTAAAALPPPRPLPAPGRHAARRGWRPEWPTGLRGRLALDPAQVAVVAVLVAVGLAVTSWWLVRGDPDPAADVTQAPARALVSMPTTAASGDLGSAAPSSPATVTVDVSGKVRRPGIAVLDPGSRVVDALEAAGGARPGADLTGLNLARVLVDGEQVVVGLPAPVGAAAAAVPSPGAPGLPLVNLNTASETELDTLPEVGPVTAQSILAWRDEHGGFTAVEELLEVDGIGDATLQRIAPYVTV